MKRTVRRTIFYGMTLAFLIITPVIVLYAIGYSFDFSRHILEPTGGIFVKTNTAGISVFLNGEPYTTASFLTRGVLIAGLEPGAYRVEISKPGYFPWRKTVDVAEQLIQEFRFIILVPQTPNTEILFGTTTPATAGVKAKGIWPNPAGSRILLASEERGTATLRVIDAGTGTTSRPVARFPGFSLDETTWNPSGTAVLAALSREGRKTWEIISSESPAADLLLDRNSRLLASSSEVIRARDIKRLTWGPGLEEFFVETQDRLYLWNRRENRVTPVLKEIHSFEPDGPRIYFVTLSGFLAEAGLDGTKIRTLDRPGFVMNEHPFRLIPGPSGALAIIDSGGAFYMLNSETDKILPLSDQVTMAKFAPDGPILGFVKNETFRNFYLTDEARQPFRKRFSNIEVLNAATPIRDFIWFGEKSTHIVFTTEKGVFLGEDDNRFGSSVTTIREGNYLIAENPGNRNAAYLFNGVTLERILLGE